MDRDGLVAMIEGYSKRSDLTTEIETYFIPNCEARIGRALRSNENYAQQSQAEAGPYIAAPSDFGAVISLEHSGDRGWNTLVSQDTHTINDYEAAGGIPCVYFYDPVNGFDVRPFLAGTYRLRYWRKPVLASGTDTDAVLDRWPNLYLYGSLAELHYFEYQFERGLAALQVFTAELNEINKSAERERTDKPAMRRA